MPQTKSFGTDNILACWQGGTSAGVLYTRAAQQCTLTQVHEQEFLLALGTGTLDDENMSVKLCVYGIPLTSQSNFITYGPGISASGFVVPSGFVDLLIKDQGGDLLSNLFFNIVVTQCTDFVSQIEGPPGNP